MCFGFWRVGQESWALSQQLYAAIHPPIYPGRSSDMRFKLLTILVSLAVVLSMVSGATCVAGFPWGGKPPCHKSRAHAAGITQNTASACHLRACQTAKSPLFLLPEALARRQATEKRATDPLPTAPALMPSLTAGRHFFAAKEVLRLPSAFFPPPLFSLHCAYIC